ncbi:hypothetical protein Nepgr_009247 [Nepenthes gracilis]|uniref:Uncharacterized protein n=1 Tax=Nepenthes gracilis TaxID=150966 RepID=A0AAD3XJZ5_NEPGR|nr:hypothetical protein Nepgr_009247 [Nepenthes gracilis]
MVLMELQLTASSGYWKNWFLKATFNLAFSNHSGLVLVSCVRMGIICRKFIGVCSWTLLLSLSYLLDETTAVYLASYYVMVMGMVQHSELHHLLRLQFQLTPASG